MASGIYEIHNAVNGKRYIGSAVNLGNRKRQHFQSLARGDHHSVSLQRAWKKYGQLFFSFTPLLYCSKENLILYEQVCMDAYKPEYNIAPKAGSQLGLRMNDEAKAKMSEAAKRTKNFFGKKHSAESKAKISANRKGKNLGPRSPETLAKIGAAHRGRPKSEEQKAKISATLTGTTTGRGTLTEEQVRDIRTLWATGNHRKCEIAKILGVSPLRVNTVVDGHGYGWVK